MASAGGTATLGRTQIIRAALPLQRRRRNRRLSGGGDLREIRDLKRRCGRRRRGRGLFGVGVAGEGGDEGIRIREVDGLGRVLCLNRSIFWDERVFGGRRDLLQRGCAVESRFGRRWWWRHRGSSETRVTGSGSAQKRNDLLELGNGHVSDSSVIGFNFHGRL
ncbi:hypothetical protein V8G54_017105 [Vigna mungo]|uniref:Uncharacterized protein n=1 Tax=Vigna mungo TaxID=3915 RepID=A0AAQ3NMN1_VIGMU